MLRFSGVNCARRPPTLSLVLPLLASYLAEASEAAGLLCDAACVHHGGEPHTCKARIDWLHSKAGSGSPLATAIETVNNQCQDQCACQLADFSQAGQSNSTGAAAASVGRRRRNVDMTSCRRRQSGTGFLGMFDGVPAEDVGTGWRCRGNSMVVDGTGSRPRCPVAAPQAGAPQACLCVFDIDRTLTGKQSDTTHCQGNRELELYDAGYGGGKATLSALANAGIRTTFCNSCYLGITSAGHGSGEHSPWNKYILEQIMRGDVQDAFSLNFTDSRRWSYGTNVHSPYVLGQGNRVKQEAVEKIRQWFGEAPRSIDISPLDVYFFGDRTENIEPFAQKCMNSREISCGSRDPSLYGGSGMVGYCGARPSEIQRSQGNFLCDR